MIHIFSNEIWLLYPVDLLYFNFLLCFILLNTIQSKKCNLNSNLQYLSLPHENNLNVKMNEYIAIIIYLVLPTVSY